MCTRAGTWTWQNVRTNATTDVFLAELREATWYELKMKACNSAGCGNQSSQFATLDYDGSEYKMIFICHLLWINGIVLMINPLKLVPYDIFLWKHINS